MDSKKFKTFGLFIKEGMPKALSIAQKVAKHLIKKECKVFVSKEAREITSSVKEVSLCEKEEMPEKVDIVVVFGGDGSFLKMARQMVSRSVPILGVNLGRLGFLVELAEEGVLDALNSINNGDFRLQERSLMEASVVRDSKIQFSVPVVNDAVVKNTIIARSMDMEIRIDSTNVARIEADGVILSTPTGSTAYSLSAGGPIVHPTVAATVICPICPHSLTMRPIVIPDSMDIEVRSLKNDGPSTLTLDGQFSYNLEPKDIVRIKKFKKHPLFVISTSKQDYFMLLKNKFKLGQRGEEKSLC